MRLVIFGTKVMQIYLNMFCNGECVQPTVHAPQAAAVYDMWLHLNPRVGLDAAARGHQVSLPSHINPFLSLQALASGSSFAIKKTKPAVVAGLGKGEPKSWQWHLLLQQPCPCSAQQRLGFTPIPFWQTRTLTMPLGVWGSEWHSRRRWGFICGHKGWPPLLSDTSSTQIHLAKPLLCRVKCDTEMKKKSMQTRFKRDSQ